MLLDPRSNKREKERENGMVSTISLVRIFFKINIDGNISASRSKYKCNFLNDNIFPKIDVAIFHIRKVIN